LIARWTPTLGVWSMNPDIVINCEFISQ
jgi:hypothetical protein